MLRNYVGATILAGWMMILPAAANEIKPVTGVQWSSATETEKKAFLYGLGTMIQLEHELAVQQKLPSDRKSLVPTFVQGLKGTTLMEVMNYVDTYYQQHPGRLDRPVVEIIWTDLAVPRQQQAGIR